MDQASKIKSRFKLFSLLAVLFLSFNIQTSLAKEYYYYQDFDVDIKINQDSTFDVIEKQTYFLDGSFGFLNRDVAMKDIDAVTDIEVYDENNNIIPKRELDINSITGAKHIQWNFARRDFNKEQKSWTIKYKVHGGISFLKDYDEIYRNAIPSIRDVVIQNVKVTMSLPDNEKFRSDLIRLYAEDVPSPIAGSQLNCEPKCTNNYKKTPRSNLPLVQQGSERSSEPAMGGYYFNSDNTKAIFWGKNIKPNTNFTIAVGFPKGIVNQSAFWNDFILLHYGQLLSIIIMLFCIIIGYLYWHKTERSREGKRAIVPQYEPPQNLRPAMAEVIIKEKLTDKGLAATIIDLAVRGYVRIKEEENKTEENFMFIMIILPITAFFILTLFSDIIFNERSFIPKFIELPLIVIYAFILYKKFVVQKAYVVKKIKEYKKDLSLEKYEMEYLSVLFNYKDYFSMKELKNNPVKSRELYEKIKKVKDKIYEETELDTKAYEIGLKEEKNKNIIFGILFFIVFFIIPVFSIAIGQFFALMLTIIVSAVALYAFIKYEARLSDSGIKLKEDWLGFKMYLETAEKYRMQNLKPEYFEKYLPYAMIFGIEKKWAKAFETMNIPQPTWYGGNAVVAGHIRATSVATSFSPSVFSASFASSFSSAFASSGASGASGGGGGAGGGGGGGGRGAG